MEIRDTLIVFANELRRTVRMLVLVLICSTVLIFFLAPRLLQVIQEHLADTLYFFSVAGPFLAHVKLSFFCAVYVLMPYILTVVWCALAKPFKVSRLNVILFIIFTCLLFYFGTLFCYFVTLPFGIKFLLGFGSAELHPVISVSRFVNFTTIFVLAFGCIFELPMFMVFSAKVGLVTRKFYEKNRRYAILFIAVVAALLTPTPDVVNMMLMGGPLYLLYESGIVILFFMRVA